jgi:hypothetical protein
MLRAAVMLGGDWASDYLIMTYLTSHAPTTRVPQAHDSAITILTILCGQWRCHRCNLEDPRNMSGYEPLVDMAA